RAHDSGPATQRAVHPHPHRATHRAAPASAPICVPRRLPGASHRERSTMSNYLAVATVSAAMGYVLRNVSQVVEGGEITYERPDRLEARSLPVETGINLYLYRTRTDASFRNQDLPTRWDSGLPVQRPVAPLSLNYLVTFFGDDSKFEPQRLLGWTSST